MRESGTQSTWLSEGRETRQGVLLRRTKCSKPTSAQLVEAQINQKSVSNQSLSGVFQPRSSLNESAHLGLIGPSKGSHNWTVLMTNSAKCLHKLRLPGDISVKNVFVLPDGPQKVDIRWSSKLDPHLLGVTKVATVQSASSADDSSASGFFFILTTNGKLFCGVGISAALAPLAPAQRQQR